MIINNLSIMNLLKKNWNNKKGSKANDPLEELFAMQQHQPSESNTNDNNIYFYDDVTQKSCLDLNKKINEMNKTLLKYSIDHSVAPNCIYLHINSFGGDLFAAFSTIDTIKNSKIPIVSIIEGCAASAATIISIVCHKRFMTKNSLMLLHQLSSGCWGKYEELHDDYVNNTKLMDILKNVYLKNSSIKLDELNNILKRYVWMDSDICQSYNLVDGIWSGHQIKLEIFNPLEINKKIDVVDVKEEEVLYVKNLDVLSKSKKIKKTKKK